MTRLSFGIKRSRKVGLARMPGSGDTRRLPRIEPRRLWSSLGRIADLSPCGARIIPTGQNHLPGDEVKLLISTEAGPINVSGRVVWARKKKGLREIGVEFDPANEKARLRLTEYSEQNATREAHAAR